MEMRTSNAPDARLGQGRVCLGGEGEGALVPSALPRQEPFQTALRDSSEREETSGIRSRYMARARRGQRRATDAGALTLARVEIMTSMSQGGCSAVRTSSDPECAARKSRPK